MMIKATFVNLETALEHARRYGGWLFKPKDGIQVTWYDAFYYTQTDVLLDSAGPGTVGTRSTFE